MNYLDKLLCKYIKYSYQSTNLLQKFIMLTRTNCNHLVEVNVMVFYSLMTICYIFAYQSFIFMLAQVANLRQTRILPNLPFRECPRNGPSRGLAVRVL